MNYYKQPYIKDKRKYIRKRNRNIAICKYCGASIIWFKNKEDGGWFAVDTIIKNGYITLLINKNNNPQYHNCPAHYTM